MPKPIVWEPCGPEVAGGVFSCRMMAFDWTPETKPYINAFYPEAAVVQNGQAILQFLRAEVDRRTAMIAPADGPPRVALRWPRSTKCGAGEGTFSDGHFSWTIGEGAGATPESTISAAIGGRDAAFLESLRIVERGPRGVGPFQSYSATRFGMVAIGKGTRLLDWDSGTATTLVSASTSAGYQPWEFASLPEGIIFQAGQKSVLREFLWTSSGIIDLLGPSLPADRIVPAAATDGTTLVWLESAIEIGEYPLLGLWAATFSTDPGVIAASKRLVANTTNEKLADQRMAVGCGYAAAERAAGSPPVSTGIVVTRLADGRTFRLPGGLNGFGTPLAITCDEIFLKLWTPTKKSAQNIARVRLDSLGPGEPGL
ncbi:MAG: hypothetical protein JNL38_22170 [Myxococcales bacterium]|nr:hypothetical protein [Myxococcales bacterium]